MRTATILLVLGLSTPALADRGGYVEASPSASYGFLERTTSEATYDSGEFVTKENGEGAGYGVRVGGGFDFGNDVRLGGFVRLDYLGMDVDNYDSDLPTPTRLRTLTFGPSVTRTGKGFYARADLGIGTHKQSTDGGTYWGRSDPLTGVITVVAEGGVDRLVTTRGRVRVGLALSFTKVTYHESGDFGEYEYDTSIWSPSLVVTVLR